MPHPEVNSAASSPAEPRQLQELFETTLRTAVQYDAQNVIPDEHVRDRDTEFSVDINRRRLGYSGRMRRAVADLGLAGEVMPYVRGNLYRGDGAYYLLPGHCTINIDLPKLPGMKRDSMYHRAYVLRPNNDGTITGYSEIREDYMADLTAEELAESWRLAEQTGTISRGEAVSLQVLMGGVRRYLRRRHPRQTLAIQTAIQNNSLKVARRFGSFG